jgi:hypothetical protein
MRRERERGSFTCDYLEREKETESSEGREKEREIGKRRAINDGREGFESLSEREISLSLIESREVVWIECGLFFVSFCAVNVFMIIDEYDSLGHILKHHQGFRLYEKISKVFWLGCCEESVTFGVVSPFLALFWIILTYHVLSYFLKCVLSLKEL